jgi:hypothetical protein
MQDGVQIFEPVDVRDRRLQRLVQYWQEKSGGRLFPDRADLDPVDFTYILGFVTLVDIVPSDDPADTATTSRPSENAASRTEAIPQCRYFFRLDGSRLAEISGTDYTGRYLDQLPWPDYVDFIRWTYDEVLRKQRPLGYRRQGNIDEHTFDEETIILPLGAGHGRIEKLLVAVIPGELNPVDSSVIL